MTELEKATAILAAALGVAIPEVAEALKSETAVDAYTKQFEDVFKEQRDQGNKTAIGKSRRDVERAFKAAGVENPSFDDLSAAIEAVQSKSTATSVKDLNPEEILKLKPVVDALNAERLKIDAAKEEGREEERNTLKKEREDFTRKQTQAKVREAAEKLITEPNPNFTKPTQRLKLIEDLVKMGDYQLDKDGNIQLVDEHGNLQPGKMGKSAKFEDRVREIADDLYGLPTSKEKESTGMTQDQASSGAAASTKKYTGELPKTPEAYAALMANNKLSDEAKQEIQDWRKAEKPF